MAALEQLSESEINELKKVVGSHGELIFIQRAGSWSFNMNTPTSDIDYFGIYVTADPLANHPDTFHHSVQGNTGNDWVIYELGKYIGLLGKGNPKVIEPLFSPPRYSHSTPFWDSIKSQLVTRCLSRVVLAQYLGFAAFEAKGPTKQVLANPNTPTLLIAKPIYHSIRLSREAKLIASGQHPRVYWEGEARDELMAIRTASNGKSSVELIQLANQELEQAKIEADKSTLPREIDYEWVGQLLVESRIPALNRLAIEEHRPQPFSNPPVEVPLDIPQWSLQILERSKTVLNKAGVHKFQFLAVVPAGSYSIAKLCQLHESVSKPYDYLVVYHRSTLEIMNPYKEVPTYLHETSDSTGKYGRHVILCELEIAVSQSITNHLVYEALTAIPNDPRHSSDDVWFAVDWLPIKSVLDEAYLQGATTTLGLVNQYLGLSSGQLKPSATWPEPMPENADVADLSSKQHRAIYFATRFITQAKLLLQSEPNTKPKYLSTEDCKRVIELSLASGRSAADLAADKEVLNTTLTELQLEIKRKKLPTSLPKSYAESMRALVRTLRFKL